MTGRTYGAKTDFRYSICNQKCFNARPTQLLNTFTSDVEDQASALILNKNNPPVESGADPVSEQYRPLCRATQEI